MPYIFIWGGYIFRGLKQKDQYGQTITHITQGCIEKHFGTTKIANGHLGIYPAEYAEESVNGIITSCQVIKTLKKQKKTEKSMFNLIINLLNH